MKLKHMPRFGVKAVNPLPQWRGGQNTFSFNNDRVQPVAADRSGVAAETGWTGSWLGKLIVRMKGRLGNPVPEGYEDELGFHYGSPPSQQSHC
jgi:hypothetical protein